MLYTKGTSTVQCITLLLACQNFRGVSRQFSLRIAAAATRKWRQIGAHVSSARASYATLRRRLLVDVQWPPAGCSISTDWRAHWRVIRRPRLADRAAEFGRKSSCCGGGGCGGQRGGIRQGLFRARMLTRPRRSTVRAARVHRVSGAVIGAGATGAGARSAGRQNHRQGQRQGTRQ
jgi:hypothetical protein